jgi:hypothetical protein
MTQPPEHPIEPPAGPPLAYTSTPPPVAKHARLYQAAAWVVIVAGTVFVLAVVFFAGAELTGHGPQYRHHHGMFAPESPNGPDGPPPPYVIFPGGPFPPGSGPGGPWGPWGPGMGPGGPGGPGGHGRHGGPDQPPPPPPTYTP